MPLGEFLNLRLKMQCKKFDKNAKFTAILTKIAAFNAFTA